MKYLYMILRLFFCPHKHVFANQYNARTTDDKRIIAFINEYRCSRCGNIKRERIRLCDTI